MTMKDEVEPGEKWKFDAEVSECFEDMLNRSIPQYDVMRLAVQQMACKYIQPNTDVMDIGCSRGDALDTIISTCPYSTCRYLGIEVSDPMIEIARRRFMLNSNVTILKHDLRESIDKIMVRPSVVLSVLTLQFIPIEYRMIVLSEIYGKLRKGGALIMVEKVLGNSAKIDKNMVNIYFDMKRKNGYSDEAIRRKKLSLEGVLVPMTAQWNENLLSQTGFTEVDCFWRWMNFAGWVAVKK